MMPGKFYVRAFIKQYAEAVDLEPEEIFEQYKDDIPLTVNDDIPEKLSRVQSRKNISGGNSKVFDILPKILIGVFILGFIAVLYYFLAQKNTGEDPKEPVGNNEDPTVTFEESENLAKNNEKESDKENAEEDTSKGKKDKDQKKEKQEETPKQEIDTVQSGGKETVYELKKADKFELKVVSTGKTWVNILNGKGSSLFQGMLTNDGTDSKSIDFSKEPEAVIIVGNSSETEIYVNDEKIEYAISPSQSVRQDITIRYSPSNE